MAQNGMTTTDLGALLGSKSVASEVLNGKRPLSRANVFALANRFCVEPGLFLQPPAQGTKRAVRAVNSGSAPQGRRATRRKA